MYLPKLLVQKRFKKHIYMLQQYINLNSFFFFLSVQSQYKQLLFKKNIAIKCVNNRIYFTKKSEVIFFLFFFKKIHDTLLQGYHARFRVLGLGYRFWILKDIMVFEIGRTHRKFLNLRGVIGIVRKKLNFIVFSFSKHSINIFCLLILNLRRISPFKPKGLLPLDQEILKKPMVVSNR